MTRSQNRHFHFNHKQKTVKKVDHDDEGNSIPIIEYKDGYYNTRVSEKLTSILQIKQYAEEQVLAFDRNLDQYTNSGSK